MFDENGEACKGDDVDSGGNMWLLENIGCSTSMVAAKLPEAGDAREGSSWGDDDVGLRSICRFMACFFPFEVFLLDDAKHRR